MQSNKITTESPKLKIKTTVQVYDNVELDIDLPYFCKAPDAFWMITDQNKAIRVSGYPSLGCIMLVDPTHSHNAKDIAAAVAITREEFNKAYQTALYNIQKTAA